MLDPAQTKLDFLKLEIGLLASKEKDTVDALWRIRVYAYTFWFACIGAALAGLSLKDSPAVIWPLVGLSFLPPVVAAYVDATYHGWYRRLVLRQKQIENFLNMQSDTSLDNRLAAFPVYNLDASLAAGRLSPGWKWETSMIRSLASFTPLFIYVSQLCGSAVVVLSFASHHPCTKYIPLIAVAIITVSLLANYETKSPKNY